MFYAYIHLLHLCAVLASIKDEEYMAVILAHLKKCPVKCNDTLNVPSFPFPKTTTEYPVTTGDVGIIVDPGVVETDACCGFCDCDPDCEVFGSCCPHIYSDFEIGKATVDSSRFICVKPQYITDTDKTSIMSTLDSNDTWMIGKCKSAVMIYLDDTFEYLCLNPGSDGSVHSVVPVTDGAVHYRNKYCGLCNGKDFRSLTNWQLKVACGSLVADDENVLHTVEEKKCNIFYIPPKSVPVEKCYMPPYSISRCNVTGKWQHYNKTIEKACNAFVDPFNRTYKNYFCHLCNDDVNEDTVESYGCQIRDDIVDVAPSFTALLDLGEEDMPDMPDVLICNALTQFKDYKMTICRDIKCNEHRYLSGLQCLRKPAHMNKCYRVFVNLIPIRPERFSGIGKLQSIASMITETMSSNYTSVRKYQLYMKTTDNSGSNYISYIVFEVLVAVTNIDGIDAEADLIEKLHDRRFDIYKVKMMSYSKSAGSDAKLHIVHHNNSVVDKLTPVHSEAILDDDSIGAFCSGDVADLFSKILICPFIQIGVDEWYISTKNNILTIEKELTVKTFSKWVYEQKNNIINICLEDFLSVYDVLPEKKNLDLLNNNAIGPKQIVAFVCVIMSLASLLITIVVYAWFSVLQSQPGMNNVILCICLFLAQSMYQFGAGQRSVSFWECSVIGAFCHFFWLSVMFSMNSCSVQMYLIFKKSMKLLPKFSWKITLKYLLYIVLISFGFVVVNVTASVIRSGGRESGYGGNVCYISSHVMHLITFILPTTCTIVANLSMFSYVVFKLEKSIISSSKMNVDRNYFGVYARLSTLTGLTWIFGFILLFVNSDVVDYLFIIFNASQGIFIMIAFVLNQRVFSLCSKSVALEHTSSTMASSQRISSNSFTKDRKLSGRNIIWSESEPQPSTSGEYKRV